MYVIYGFIDKNSSSKKILSIIYKLLMFSSIINISMNLLTDKMHEKKIKFNYLEGFQGSVILFFMSMESIIKIGNHNL